MSGYGSQYIKKRWVITFNKDTNRFCMISPNNQVFDGVVPWELSNIAFQRDADEVVHDYDLTIVDILGKLR